MNESTKYFAYGYEHAAEKINDLIAAKIKDTRTQIALYDSPNPELQHLNSDSLDFYSTRLEILMRIQLEVAAELACAKRAITEINKQA